MNELITGMLKDIPSVAALIITVLLFLRFMGDRAKEAERIMAQHDEAMRAIAHKYDETARASIDAVKENSAALGRVSAVIERCVTR